MSPEGKKLFSKALIGLGLMVVLMLGMRAYEEFGSSNGLDESIDINLGGLPPIKTQQKNNLLAESKKELSAFEGISDLLHFYAYNNYRSNRIKKAIYLWEIADYLYPNQPIVDLRLKESKQLLFRVAKENIALGYQDYKYLRYERAIVHWERALNLVSGIDQELYDSIDAYIALARKQSNR